MNKLLKGNYKLKNKEKTVKKKKKKKSLEEFESKAIEKLGGSIAFVSKSQLLWDGEEKDEKK